MNLKGRHFLTLKDYTPEEIAYLLELSADLKKKKKEGVLVDTLRGKNVALIFEKTSTRTRCSFEVAAPIWIRRDLRSAKKRASQIPQKFWEACTKVSSTVDLVRRSWKNWQNTQVFRYGTV